MSIAEARCSPVLLYHTNELCKYNSHRVSNRDKRDHRLTLIQSTIHMYAQFPSTKPPALTEHSRIVGFERQQPGTHFDFALFRFARNFYGMRASSKDNACIHLNKVYNQRCYDSWIGVGVICNKNKGYAHDDDMEKCAPRVCNYMKIYTKGVRKVKAYKKR
jgi:hypothetical protein